MKVLKSYTNIIPANVSCICNAVKDIINNLSNLHGEIEKDTLFEIKVVLNELILNAAKHGSKGDTSKQIKITAGLTENDFVYFIIEDEGEGYDYACQKEKSKHTSELTDLCEMKETGRGILIVEGLCDKVKYNKKGNKVIAIKNLVKA